MSLLFKVTYENEELPPPYKHSYTIQVATSSKDLTISYDLKYLDRDSIDDEEIFAEGFTLEDDFKWEGELKPVWKEYLTDFLKKSSFNKADITSDLKFVFPENNSPQSPQNIKEWEYLLQELTQAIFEEGGREAPLELNFAEISKESNKLISLIISFAERSLILLETVGGKEKVKKLDWKESKYILNTVYSIEYLGEKALLSPPKKEGKFIDIGEGAWYEFGVAALNPRKKNNVLDKLEKIFKFEN